MISKVYRYNRDTLSFRRSYHPLMLAPRKHRYGLPQAETPPSTGKVPTSLQSMAPLRVYRMLLIQ